MPGSNPFGLYLYLEDVDALAAEFSSEILGKSAPENKPSGMYEFALSDPDQTRRRLANAASPIIVNRPWRASLGASSSLSGCWRTALDMRQNEQPPHN